jgi:hypothetical protein
LESSRLTTYHKTTYPHRKRTIRLRGSFEDNGKYIRCWNCHFIVNVDRDLGDPERSGNYETDAYVYAQPLYLGGKPPVDVIKIPDVVNEFVLATEELDTIGGVIEEDTGHQRIVYQITLMEKLDTIGTIIDPNATYYTPRLPQVSKGCPFCGCTNLL